MKRPGLERTKRRTHIRLSLEHLEHRRLMAGLNVLVFTDQDGSRSLSPAVDTPAANRLVYVDLNRNLRFEDGEPLAVSGDDGMARFPGLSSGNYLIGLAGGNSAQVLTTSVTSDSSARVVAAAPGAPLTSLIASPDLKHAWSATSSGVLTPVGAGDAGRAVLNLNGRLLAVASGGDENAAWALVDFGQTQPSLYRLDFQTGSAQITYVQGIPAGQRVTGLVRAGSSIYFQLTAGDSNFVSPMLPVQHGVMIGQTVAIPSGTVIGSSVANRLAVVGSRSQLSGEDQQLGAKVSVIEIRGTTTSIQSVELDTGVSNVSYSADGQYLFASLQGGGVEVFTTGGGLRSAAQLAEAAGPVSAGIDGRFITANSSKPDQLILWDARTWTPSGRVQLPAGQGAVASLAVDTYGDRMLVATAAAALSASLSNPAPQAVVVTGGSEVTQASLGVRLVDRVVQLPTRIAVNQATDEDVPLSFDLSSNPALAGLGTGLLFAPDTKGGLGTFAVTPTGRVTYQAPANANGADSATLKVFDGINTTTLVIALNVRPVNDAPTDISVDMQPVDEAGTVGDVAGLATVIDVDGDAHYEITTSDSRFVVVDGQVTLSENAALDYETEPAIELEITATDLANPAFVITRRITIPVLNSNDGPTAISLSSTTILENEAEVGVGSAVVTDPDEHGPYTYSVSDDRFEFQDGELRLRSGVILDHEAEPMIDLTITVTDPSAVGGNKSVSSHVVVQVADGNDAPTSLSVASSELHSGEEGAIVGRINVVDQDTSDEFAFSVSDSRFMVDGNVLRLRDGESISRDDESVVSMMVTVTDKAGAVLAETVTLNVVNDAPFQNPRNPFDVDNDGFVYPRDALILVNRLNQGGSHVLTQSTGSGEAGTPVVYVDVNGDGLFTPLDALLLINYLNQRSTAVINNGNNNGNNGSGSGSGNTNGTNTSGTNTGGDKDPDNADLTLDDPSSSLAEGEGVSFDSLTDDSFSHESLGACQPWLASTTKQEKARRDAIDAELELLVEELSRARLS